VWGLKKLKGKLLLNILKRTTSGNGALKQQYLEHGFE